MKNTAKIETKSLITKQKQHKSSNKIHILSDNRDTIYTIKEICSSKCYKATQLEEILFSYLCQRIIVYMLLPYKTEGRIEAGCDEAGRGCLAGPVFAAAVILPPDFRDERLNDSKQLSEKQRYSLRPVIEEKAIAWGIGIVTPEEIDKINILKASFLAMHRAIDALSVRPEALLIDGNRFTPYRNLPFSCEVKGDGRYLSIAAASILAKTYRDDYMMRLHKKFPQYHWDENKGYPPRAHRAAIAQYGPTPYHRQTFNLLGTEQHSLFE